MFLLLLAIALRFASLTQAAPQDHGAAVSKGKIIGGEPTCVQKIPYQASLQFYSRHSCGAVVISKDYVLTAAHCTDGYVHICCYFCYWLYEVL